MTSTRASTTATGVAACMVGNCYCGCGLAWWLRTCHRGCCCKPAISPLRIIVARGWDVHLLRCVPYCYQQWRTCGVSGSSVPQLLPGEAAGTSEWLVRGKELCGSAPIFYLCVAAMALYLNEMPVCIGYLMLASCRAPWVSLVGLAGIKADSPCMKDVVSWSAVVSHT